MTSDATDNTMRAEFEAAMLAKGEVLNDLHQYENGKYCTMRIHFKWLGYKAARADTARQVAEAVAAEREALTRTCRAIEEVSTTKANQLHTLDPMRSWHNGKRAAADYMLAVIRVRTASQYSKPDREPSEDGYRG